jgi:hypothetical protein
MSQNINSAQSDPFIYPVPLVYWGREVEVEWCDPIWDRDHI